MSTNGGSFRPDELAGGDSRVPDVELAESFAAARELERAIEAGGIRPSASFSDRVMTSIAAEPRLVTSAFLRPLRARPGLAGLVASVRVAWTVALGGSRPARARGLAFAYVLAVLLIGASLTGVAAYGAAGAIGLLDPDQSPSPSLIEPGPTASPDESGETVEPSESTEPSEIRRALGEPTSHGRRGSNTVSPARGHRPA